MKKATKKKSKLDPGLYNLFKDFCPDDRSLEIAVLQAMRVGRFFHTELEDDNEDYFNDYSF